MANYACTNEVETVWMQDSHPYIEHIVQEEKTL